MLKKIMTMVVLGIAYAVGSEIGADVYRAAKKKKYVEVKKDME